MGLIFKLVAQRKSSTLRVGYDMISAQKYFHNNGVALMIGYNLINIYFFVMLFTAIYWAVHIKSVNSTGYATFMLALSFAIGIYIFGYAMELNSNTEAQILF
ncbi:MAG TPA: hypothetical protein DCY58_11810 [Acetobacterium sp.]|jgi:hypothetical protein|nr:hypothetical protein [Acetobacterium sp.]